jgi:DNA-binding response OmpR family regulator
MGKHLLIIDDDALMRRGLAFNLEKAGYRVSSAANAEDGLAFAQRDPPDLVLLDIGLPGMDGLAALNQFKQQLHSPVIFVTGRRRKLDEVVGLELGADDYITKPYDMDVLLAHIKAVLRRFNSPQDSVLDLATCTVGDLIIDPVAHTTKIKNRSIDLSPREFAILHTFALRPDQVISVEDILTQVWGAEYIGQPQVVYVHIRWLREKIENDPDHPERIVTIRGVGYKLVSQDG